MDNQAVKTEKNNLSIENYICDNCGGVMKFDIKKQVLKCSSCGTIGDIKTDSLYISKHELDDYKNRETDCIPFENKSSVICQNCGAEIIFDSFDTAAMCPMCGSTQVAAEKQKAGVPPDGIIPFKIDKSDAEEKFRIWIKKRWFAPNKLKKTYQEGNLSGNYLPFWTYDTDADGFYYGQGGITRTYTDSDGKEHTTTDWYPVSGSVSKSFDDIQICASQKNESKYIDKALPFDTINNTIPYSPQYLSGFKAERYSIKADAGFEKAKDIVENELKSMAYSQILSRGYDQAIVNSIDIDYNNVKYKHVLLPVWNASFTYKSKQYIYFINGETGKVSGSRPYSVPKIAIAVSITIAIILALIFFFKDNEANALNYNFENNYNDSHFSEVIDENLIQYENYNEDFLVL